MKPTPSSRYQRRSTTRALGRGLPSSVSSSAGPTAASNNNRLLSGDHAGLYVLAGPAVKRFASPPVLGTTQMEERYSCLRSSIVVTTKATLWPSGEMRGLLRNLN